MGMPSGIPIIDLMLGIPSADPKPSYGFMRPLFRDRESLESFDFPVEYIFKDVPKTGRRDDYIKYTLEEMDKYGIERGLIGVSESDVLAIVDSTNRYVAVSIIASGFVPGPPPVGAMYTGTVKSISNASWTIRDDATRADVTFTVNSQTKIEPGIGVNDRVVVMAVRDNDKLTAIAIVRARMM